MPGGASGLEFIAHGEAGAEFLLHLSVYRLNAIKKAAYKFGAKCHVLIEPVSDQVVRVALRAKQKLEDSTRLAGDFANEVLDQELREVVAAETEPVRNLLLAHTFSKSALIQPEFDSAEFRADPLGIRASDTPHPRGSSSRGSG